MTITDSLTEREKDQRNLQEPEINFRKLLRLFRHLRKGGTRKGACGWAGINHWELDLRISLDRRFAGLVEKYESYSLARDERILHFRVCEGNCQALFFRLRKAYSQDKDRGKGGAVRKGYERSESYARIEGEIAALSPDERRGIVTAHRSTAACPA